MDLVARWRAVTNAIMVQDWEAFRRGLAEDVLHVQAHGRREVPTTLISGAEEAVDVTRALYAERPWKHEIVSALAVGDTLTIHYRNSFNDGKVAIGAAIIRYDEDGRLQELYASSVDET
jgi:hypothetical protein